MDPDITATIFTGFGVLFSVLFGVRRLVHTEIDGLRSDLTSQIAGVRSELTTQITAVNTRIDNVLLAEHRHGR